MFISLLKKKINDKFLRRKFPLSVIYQGVSLDKKSILGINTVLFQGASLFESQVGNYSYVQRNSVINNTEIGPFSSIAGGVTIGLAIHPTNMVSTSPVFYDNKQPLPHFFVNRQIFSENLPRTTIGADVWVGQGVLIKAGVKVGVGAVIGAGSIVTKDIPPYAVAAGIPCRVIRRRFEDDICQKLVESKWWLSDESRLHALSFYFQDAKSFLKKIDELDFLDRKVDK